MTDIALVDAAAVATVVRLAAGGDELAFAQIDGPVHGVVDLKSGRELWRLSFEAVDDPVLMGDILLIRGRDSDLHAYDAKTGRKRWTVEYRDRGRTLSGRPDLRIADGRTK